jgi:hypothetical protein
MRNLLYNVVLTENNRTVDIAHMRPERLAQCGDVYEWTRFGATLGGHEYRPGDKMVVLERTRFAPYRRVSELGNLLVQGPHGTSVWTAFDHCIATGDLKLIEPEAL